MCKSVCKCMCRCADLALLPEGCVRVACRKDHRTTVVLQKEEKKKKEPQSHQNQNFLIEMERARERGEGRRVCGDRRQERGRIGGGERGKLVVGWKKLHAHRDINTHNTQTPTPPLHCPSKTDNPSPISPLPLCAPKAGADGFLYLSFAAVG